MSAAVTYPHIVKEAGKPARLEKHRRTRVSMIVVDNQHWGWSAEQIVLQYPYLTLAEVYAALAYYYDNKEEIDQELAEEDAEFERYRKEQQSDPMIKRLVDIRKSGRIDAGDAG